MKRIVVAAALLVVVGCERDVVEPDVAVSVGLDSLPFPAVVVGDTLRDTSGIAQPVRAEGFNFRGEALEDLPFRYFVLDRGATADSVTGFVVGDSLRPTPVRVLAVLGPLQTPPRELAVVRRPESLTTVSGPDTIRYSVLDTTANVSAALTVRLLHTTDTVAAVPRWIVTFAIEYPADTSLTFLVGDAGAPSRIDTTSGTGDAGRRVRVRPEQFTAVEDSVVVVARARYRGQDVTGSPARLVVHLRPRVP